MIAPETCEAGRSTQLEKVCRLRATNCNCTLEAFFCGLRRPHRQESMTADAMRLGCQPMLASMLGNFECAGCSSEGSIGPPNGKLSRSKNSELSRAKNKILDALTIAYRTSYFVHRDTSTPRPYKRHGAERPSISSPLRHLVLLCVSA